MSATTTHRQPGTGQHVLLGLCAVVVFGVLAARTMGSSAPSVTPEPTVTAVEHTGPSTVHLLRSYGLGRNIMEYTVQSGTGVYLNIPEQWQRREVRGGALSDVRLVNTVSGYARWSLPTGVTASFWLTDDTKIVLQHPSPYPLLVKYTRVDLDSGKSETKTVILTEKPVEL